ncbi:MAG: hypothetical protein EOM72_00345 [Opitutae bacterium]|nr:hypothetical protein [Opitutae bacterium]
MKIVLVGDIYPGGDLEGADARRAVAVPAYHAADCRVGTLESALSDSAVRADKYVLTCKPSGARVLKEMGLSAVSLAQNHIQDMGEAGIGETLRHLEAEGIGHVGAGRTLEEARRPFWINGDLCVLSYCRHRELTLTQVAVAEADKPGVASLTLADVRADLERLPAGKRAILVFHWGCEHLWLTQYGNLELARRLLEDDRVALIAGSHPHRVQGVLEHVGKKAYFSLGNFLFPNFYLNHPCVQVAPPDPRPRRVPTTRLYHRVHRLTHKKWPQVNRVSLMVEFDSGSGVATHRFVVQRDARPQVVPAPWWIRIPFALRLELLSRLSARCPQPVYERLFAAHHAVVFWWWRRRILLAQLRSLGIAAIGSKTIHRLSRRAARPAAQGNRP